MTHADATPLTEIMTRNVTTAGRETDAKHVAALMIDKHIGCVPVVDHHKPIGMITKVDLVERMLAERMPRTAGDLMMPMAIAINDRATIAHAAALMAQEDVHHLPIVDVEGRLIGVVSTMDIVRWLAQNEGM